MAVPDGARGCDGMRGVPRRAADKLVSLERLLGHLAALPQDAQVVLTNGCFDWLHAGHLRTLEHARSLGDVLVVGVNDDASVRRLKGPGRPVVPARQRALLVAALECVDWVVIFEGDTATGLVQAVRPQWYVKGGDYRLDRLPEVEPARRVGARVVLVPPEPGLSTTRLLARAVAGAAAGAGDPGSEDDGPAVRPSPWEA